jgi:hypothetical protein
MRHPTHAKYWKGGAIDELGSLIDLETFVIVPRKDVPDGVKPITSKWVWKRKAMLSMQKVRFKGRLVIRGFEQVYGVDYDETYAPVSRLSSFRLLLALAARSGWKIEHMDVVTAFLYPEVDHDIYMELPEGLELVLPGVDPEKYVCKLQKALYGLKQAPRLWYKNIHSFLVSLGFKPSDFDPNVYINSKTGVYILLYVDDLLIFAPPSSSSVPTLKKALMDRYKMTDLGSATQFLGMEIIYEEKHGEEGKNEN